MEHLAEAHRLLTSFKKGRLPSGQLVTKKQENLVALLAQDFGLVTESFRERVLQLAELDTKWNKATQKVIHNFYALQESGQVTQAHAVRQNFIVACPSTWYRSIVNEL